MGLVNPSGQLRRIKFMSVTTGRVAGGGPTGPEAFLGMLFN